MVWKVKRWGFFEEDIPALLGSLGRFPVPLLGRWKMGPRPRLNGPETSLEAPLRSGRQSGMLPTLASRYSRCHLGMELTHH